VSLKILTFCGSLRVASSNLALLKAAELLAPDGMTFTRYNAIADLPHFTPDLDDDDLVPEIVLGLRDRVAEADGLLFAVPEYMHSLPGSLKNALDWMVGCTRFPGKPVALAQVTARHGFAPVQLEEVLRTMSATYIDEACFNLRLSSNAVTMQAILADERLADIIREGLLRYRMALGRNPGA
jgi:NAD(P)H-dependent FMN reductase